jgi:hypothetical protein
MNRPRRLPVIDPSSQYGCRCFLLRSGVAVLRSLVRAPVHAICGPCEESRVYERVQQFRAHPAIQRQESSRLSERQPQPWHLEEFTPHPLQQEFRCRSMTLHDYPDRCSSELTAGRSNVSSSGSGGWCADRHPSVYEAGTPTRLGGIVKSLRVHMTAEATRTLPSTIHAGSGRRPRHSTLESSGCDQYLVDTVFHAARDYTMANCRLADGTMRYAVG